MWPNWTHYQSMSSISNEESVLPDTPITFFLSIHFPPVPGSYFTLKLITFIFILVWKEKQTEKNCNVSLTKSIPTPITCEFIDCIFSPVAMDLLWSCQKTLPLYNWIPSPFACVRKWIIKFSLSSKYLFLFLYPISFPSEYTYFDSSIFLYVLLHFSFPLKGSVDTHYHLYPPPIVSWTFSSQHCVLICPLELWLQMFTKGLHITTVSVIIVLILSVTFDITEHILLLESPSLLGFWDTALS